MQRYFDMRLPEEVETRDGEAVTVGKIRIDDWSESLVCPIGYWKRFDYLDQWVDAIGRYLGGARAVALVTVMRDPALAEFFGTWVIYGEGDEAILRNRIVFASEVPRPFDPGRVDETILPRKVHEETTISEWSTSRSAIEDYLRRIRH